MQEIVIKGNQFYKRTISEHPVELHVDSLMKEISIPPKTYDFGGLQIIDDVQQELLYIVERKESIWINAHWIPEMIDEKLTLRLCLYDTNNEEAHEDSSNMRLEFEPPEDTEMIFITAYRGKRFDHSMLLWRHEGEIYLPAIPNIYDTGRVCMGEQDRQQMFDYEDLLDAHIECWELIGQSLYNNDLTNSSEWYLQCEELEDGSYIQKPYNNMSSRPIVTNSIFEYIK